VTLATVKPAHKQSDVVTIAPVAGLDVKAGLHHALGKEALYTSLLRKFSDGQKDFPERLTEAMTQDLVLAERWHTHSKVYADKLVQENCARWPSHLNSPSGIESRRRKFNNTKTRSRHAGGTR
jgi:hypothetical protein